MVTCGRLCSHNPGSFATSGSVSRMDLLSLCLFCASPLLTVTSVGRRRPTGARESPQHPLWKIQYAQIQRQVLGEARRAPKWQGRKSSPVPTSRYCCILLGFVFACVSPKGHLWECFLRQRCESFILGKEKLEKEWSQERYSKKTGSKAGVDVSAQLESFKCDNLERGLKSKLSSELINFVGEVCVSRG